MDTGNTTSIAKRGRKIFITPRLGAALDSAQVSDGKAVHILIAAAESFGLCVEDLAINRSTIHRERQKIRQAESSNIQDEFTTNVNALSSH